MTKCENLSLRIFINSVIVYLLILKTLKPHPVGRQTPVWEKYGNASPAILWYVQKVPFVSECFTIAFGSFRQFPRGVINKVLSGEAPPRGPTHYPFINHFDRKGTPFLYLLLTVRKPFTYLVTKALTLLTYVNALQ